MRHGSFNRDYTLAIAAAFLIPLCQPSRSAAQVFRWTSLQVPEKPCECAPLPYDPLLPIPQYQLAQATAPSGQQAPPTPPPQTLPPGRLPPALPGQQPAPPGRLPPALPGQQPAPPGLQLPTAPGPQQPSATNPQTQPGAQDMANNPLANEGGLAREGSTFAAPQMIGDLLFANRSINFRYNRAAGPINVANNGSTALTNPAVADDNSPIPTDRVSFRLNYFNNAQEVTGFGPATFSPAGVGTSFAQTRDYSVETYTFSLEKTFFNGWASAEIRVPFNTGLSSNLDLSAGTITGPAEGGGYNVHPTPEQSLGSTGTQFDDITVILKGLFYRTDKLALSAGLAMGTPTGADTTVNIVDFTGPSGTPAATVERDRLIHIDNETWSLSPFLAGLYTPNDRLFAQGFLQFEFPLNSSTINYTETTPVGSLLPISSIPSSLITYPTLNTPFTVKEQISEQSLMHLDVGGGYWLMREPSRTWLTGIAPTLELHYTSTLTSASVVQLPADTLFQIDSSSAKPTLVQEQPPRIGNLNGQLNILDLTAGTTFAFGKRATLATGFSFPLLGSPDRTFDWEFHLQFNYFFGAVSRQSMDRL